MNRSHVRNALQVDSRRPRARRSAIFAQMVFIRPKMVVAAAQSAPSASDGYMRELSAKNALQVATRPLQVKTRVNFVPMGNTWKILSCIDGSQKCGGLREMSCRSI